MNKIQCEFEDGARFVLEKVFPCSRQDTSWSRECGSVGTDTEMSGFLLANDSRDRDISRSQTEKYIFVCIMLSLCLPSWQATEWEKRRKKEKDHLQQPLGEMVLDVIPVCVRQDGKMCLYLFKTSSCPVGWQYDSWSYRGRNSDKWKIYFLLRALRRLWTPGLDGEGIIASTHEGQDEDSLVRTQQDVHTMRGSNFWCLLTNWVYGCSVRGVQCSFCSILLVYEIWGHKTRQNRCN